MINEDSFTTFQELINNNNFTEETNQDYNELLGNVTQIIAQLTQSKQSQINIDHITHTIIITGQDTNNSILTYKNLRILKNYLGVEDLIIYQPSRNNLIIDYNQNRLEEEEYYL